MNAELREIFRTTILRACGVNGENGVGLEVIEIVVRTAGIKATRDEIAEECAYLVDKGFLARAPKAISPENKRWRITAAGRDFLAEAGF